MNRILSYEIKKEQENLRIEQYLRRHRYSRQNLTELKKMAVHHEVSREYSALVRGSIIPDQGTICASLSRKPGSIIERIVDFENGESAVTHYRVIKEQNGHSLVSLQLETGRTHQIRIHMKHLGFPLIGDYLYNPDMEYMQRQALHCCRLAFCHPVTGEHVAFAAPLPADMQEVLTPVRDIIKESPAGCGYNSE